jgi:hypothetical protein
MENKDDLLSQFLALCVKALACNHGELFREAKTKEGTRFNCPTVPRVRKSVYQVYREIGKTYFCGSFQMTYFPFGPLFQLIKPNLEEGVPLKKGQLGYFDRSPNGPIDLATCLAVAIPFFAGGEGCDISVMFGISQSSLFNCIDIVVDGINGCEEMDITFPLDHTKQGKIARRFRGKLPLAGFSTCVGCIDGILIWMHKPRKADCKEAGVEETKFFCGRKHKFGLNLQAFCNHKKRFISISILYGVLTSDHLAFKVPNAGEYIPTWSLYSQ